MIRPPLALHHPRQHGLRGPVGRKQVEVDVIDKRLLVHLLRRQGGVVGRRGAATGIVDQNVDRSQPCLDLPGAGKGIGQRHGVGAHGQRPSAGRAQLVGHGIDLGVGAGADCDTDAFPGQGQGQGSTDAATTAGDPGNSIVEPHDVSLLQGAIPHGLRHPYRSQQWRLAPLPSSRQSRRPAAYLARRHKFPWRHLRVKPRSPLRPTQIR